MNIRVILFLAAIITPIALWTYTEDAADEVQQPIKKTRRAHFRAKNAQKKAKRQGPPTKRFEDGKVTGSIHATYMHMNYEELEVEVDSLVANKYYDIAIKYIERMVAITTEAEEHKISDLLLKVADIWYQKEDYQKAWKAYAQWEQKYPGAYKDMGFADMPQLKQAEYALFRAIDSSEKCIQDIDRDQTQTHATIELTDRFLTKQAFFTTYRDKVKQIRAACYERLIASDLSICSFYRTQGNNEVVHKRLALLEEEYSAAFPKTKDLIVTYRSTHYPDMVLSEQKQATLLAETKVTTVHAADRF